MDWRDVLVVVDSIFRLVGGGEISRSASERLIPLLLLLAMVTATDRIGEVD